VAGQLAFKNARGINGGELTVYGDGMTGRLARP